MSLNNMRITSNENSSDVFQMTVTDCACVVFCLKPSSAFIRYLAPAPCPVLHYNETPTLHSFAEMKTLKCFELHSPNRCTVRLAVHCTCCSSWRPGITHLPLLAARPGPRPQGEASNKTGLGPRAPSLPLPSSWPCLGP